MKSEWALVEVDLKEVRSVREQIPLDVQKREDVYTLPRTIRE